MKTPQIPPLNGCTPLGLIPETEMPFNLAGELLDNSLDAEGEARRAAENEAEMRRDQRELLGLDESTVRCPNHASGGATRCPRGGADLQIWQRKQWGD